LRDVDLAEGRGGVQRLLDHGGGGLQAGGAVCERPTATQRCECLAESAGEQ
jgi:hypothetical protein